MAYSLDPFTDIGLDEPLLAHLLAEHQRTRLPVLQRLWQYYRNPQDFAAARQGIAMGLVPGAAAGPAARPRQAQESGLPPRLLAARDPLADDRAPQREIVIENDIAWRVQTMVDFMFGKPVRLRSTARDPRTRELVERTLDAIWEASGGVALMQDMALLGHVYGSVDLLVRVDEDALTRRGIDAAHHAIRNLGTPPRTGSGGGRGGQGTGSATEGPALPPASPTPGAPGPMEPGAPASSAAANAEPSDLDALLTLAARAVRLELVEPTRGIPILDPLDYRRIVGYILHVERELNAVERAPGLLSAWRRPAADAARRRRADVVELISPAARQVYEDGRLVDEASLAAWTAGATPVVHIQNLSQPFRYDGHSEVEPLIPLQDELNTRLSDRAFRVTMSSFKMYLAKGLDGFDRVPVGPGRVWSTDNMEASIQAFGGDADSPSESAHIQEIREAMDKVSSVPPLASGVVRARIGNLSSATALRVTLMGLLAKTARKRVTYGRGIAQLCGLALGALDAMGVLPTAEADRGVRLEWADPLPTDLAEETAAARLKAELGVPRAQVLEDLGVLPTDAGVV